MPPHPDSTFSRALAGGPDAPVAFGLTFAPPQVIAALAGVEAADSALIGVCRTLSLDFVFAAEDQSAAFGALNEMGCEPLAVVAGPLGRTLERIGWTEGLIATVEDPVSLRRMLAEAAGEGIAAVRHAVGFGAGAIVLAEDLAGGAGPLLAPDYVFDEVFPLLTAISEVAGENGLPVVLHTDGDARAFAPAAARAGFAAMHGGGGLTAERLESLAEAVRDAGMAFLGGIPSVELRDAMHAEAAGSLAGVLARRGGVLVCDDGGIDSAEEAAAFVTALAAARDGARR